MEVTVVVGNECERGYAITGALSTDSDKLYAAPCDRRTRWVFKIADEGLTWARGWDTNEAKALRAACAL